MLTYCRLSGCSPFLGDNKQETFVNVSAVSYRYILQQVLNGTSFVRLLAFSRFSFGMIKWSPKQESISVECQPLAYRQSGLHSGQVTTCWGAVWWWRWGGGTDKHDWKHYHSTTSLAGGNNSYCIKYGVIYQHYLIVKERWPFKGVTVKVHLHWASSTCLQGC